MTHTNRFTLSLSGFFTRVRMSDERVCIESPDANALTLLLAGLCFGGPVVGLPLLLPFALGWKIGVGVLIAALFSTRIRLSVSQGKARVVRSVLFLPWSIRSCRASHDVSLSADGSHLTVGDDDWPPSVLSTGVHAMRVEELRAIHAACARLLS